MIPAHQRITVDGTLAQAAGGGSEIFTFSMAGHSGLAAQDLSAACAPKANSFWQQNSINGIPSTAVLTGVTVEDIDETGRVTDSYRTAITPVGGQAANTICTLLSNCITLETDVINSHGGKVRGRFYPPASMAVVGSTSTSAQVGTYLAQWAGLVNGFNDAGAVVSVASTANGGVIAPVTAITCDNVVDTIRRRKNHVTAVRSDPLAIPGS
uniref:Uncharacterized protein n=1 Tax=uncultured prokaryote TaxID=198431 RepID=A0A0H5Q419_9ZZZZ|nr:hypothetical protein [uncultured prokaryote]